MKKHDYNFATAYTSKVHTDGVDYTCTLIVPWQPKLEHKASART